MKIVYVFRSLTVVGGVERILIEKMNYLASLPGYGVTLITYEQGQHPIVFPLTQAVCHIDLGIEFYTQYRYGIVKRSYLYIGMLRRFKRALKKQLQRIEPDVIVSTTYSPDGDWHPQQHQRGGQMGARKPLGQRSYRQESHPPEQPPDEVRSHSGRLEIVPRNQAVRRASLP